MNDSLSVALLTHILQVLHVLVQLAVKAQLLNCGVRVGAFVNDSLQEVDERLNYQSIEEPIYKLLLLCWIHNKCLEPSQIVLVVLIRIRLGLEEIDVVDHVILCSLLVQILLVLELFRDSSH